MHIDHVTIRTRDIATARDFFVDLFDLREGTRPSSIQRIPGYWLYADGQPIVHIVGTYAGSTEPPPCNTRKVTVWPLTGLS